MLFTAALTGLMATAAMAAPYRRQTSTGQNVVYWGQNGGGTIENNDLSTYCTAEAGIDIIGMYSHSAVRIDRTSGLVTQTLMKISIGFPLSIWQRCYHSKWRYWPELCH